ncbi:MAG: FAD-dependent monooxygenase [Pseudonocardia sp.]|nr:FAD-dependent monooxygenase [Pseudonocardia sp.]
MIDVPVLVVGAGPAGMALALVLDRFGVPSLVVERNATTTTHPKSRGCTARTMELFRLWGIEDRVRAGGLPASSDVVCWCPALSGPLVATSHPEASVHSPAPKSIAPQDAVEEALADALAGRPGADVRRETELVTFSADAEGVTARIRSLADGTETDVRAAYLVGCDGSSSQVRRALGIAMEGPDTLARMVSHYVRADLSHLPHARGAVGYMVRPDDPAVPSTSVLATGPDGDRWILMQRLSEDEEPMTADAVVALLREQWAMPELEVELINVMPWRISAQVAERFRDGRVFLAGDAAHRFPPSGGQGLNSGVQDAHNLAWKLATVLHGAAPEKLLDSYEAERRPVAESNTAFSVGNLGRIRQVEAAFLHRDEDPLGWRAALVDQDDHLNSEGQGMGFVYARGAVVDDGSPLPPPDSRYYWPTDRPGARFPHMWLDPERSASTLDWFDTSFVLVCGPDATGWRAAGEGLADRLGPVLQVRVLAGLYGPLTIGTEGAVLVRPDGHVAWRSTTAGDGTELRRAWDEILAGGALVAAGR